MAPKDRPVASGQQRLMLDKFLASVQGRAFRTAQWSIGHRDDALDIVQDAMLKLVQHYADRQEDEWPPLFWCILHHRINDWYRRQRGFRSRFQFWQTGEDEEDDIIAQLPDTTADIVAELQRHQFSESLLLAVETLPLRQKQVFLLRIWEGFDVNTSARAMQCSEGSVKTHLFRAIQSLRKQLEAFSP